MNIKIISFMIILTASLSSSIVSSMSISGQNATWNTQVCSEDGLTICITGISNYIAHGKRYDITFQYGDLNDLLSLDQLSVSSGNTYLDNGPGSILYYDASDFINTWNSPYATGVSTTNAVFATQDLSYTGLTPEHFTRFRWGAYHGAGQPDIWAIEEFNDWHLLSLEFGSLYYFKGADTILGGTDPESINFRSADSFYVIAEVSNVPLPSAIWLFGSALLGLIASKRNQNRLTN